MTSSCPEEQEKVCGLGLGLGELLSGADELEPPHAQKLMHVPKIEIDIAFLVWTRQVIIKKNRDISQGG
jgi:hypothetical protein